MKMEKNKYNKVIALVVALAMVVMTVPMEISVASDRNSKQYFVKSYKVGKSEFKLTTLSRFYLSSKSMPNIESDIELMETINLIREEFAIEKYPSSEKMLVVCGDETDVVAGDIVIRIKEGMKAQAYKINVNKKVVITASDTDGIFYGLRTLLFFFENNKAFTLQGCKIKDAPAVKERTVHLDCARKYYSKKWIVRLIKDMSYMRYNALEIHFSEDQALRLESKKFPWLAGDGKYLTQKDMKKICRVAKKYHIDIIPSFDSPGHMDYIVKKYAKYVEENPEFKFEYDGETYSKKSKGFSNISNYFQYNGAKSDYNYRGIDIVNPTALAFTNALIHEYADFFAKQGCTKFNIGGDELLGWSKVTVGGKTFDFNTKWNALEHWKNYAINKLGVKKGSSSDTFINYLNTLATNLEEKGYTVRVWNDEIDRNADQHIKLKKSIEIVYWSNEFEPITKLKKNGNMFYNAVADWCYYVVRKDELGRDFMDTVYKNVNGSSIYNNWNPKSFSSPGKKKVTIDEAQYAGAYFCIWSDMPLYKSSSTIKKEITDRMWASAAKMWNPRMDEKKINGKLLSYKRFNQMIN